MEGETYIEGNGGREEKRRDKIRGERDRERGRKGGSK
jgi:hypothetical protein